VSAAAAGVKLENHQRAASWRGSQSMKIELRPEEHSFLRARSNGVDVPRRRANLSLGGF